MATPTLLSAREVEVVTYLAQSYKITNIAEALCISPGTVRKHLDNVRDKTGVRDDVGIVLLCIQLGIINMPRINIPGPWV